jgi:hypothetical protein
MIDLVAKARRKTEQSPLEGVNLKELAKKHGMCRNTLTSRLERGDSLEDALRKPVKKLHASRRIAQENGHETYHGQACSVCGCTERKTNTGHCVNRNKHMRISKS